MKPSTAAPNSEACPEPSPSHPSSRKGSLPKVFLGLALLLLVGCASASIVTEPEPSRPPAARADAANTGLVEPSPDAVSESSPDPVAASIAPTEAAVQRSDNQDDVRPVKPASVPSVEKAQEELEPISPSPAGPGPVATDIPTGDIPAGDVSSGDNPSGAPQSERESTTPVALKENSAEVSSQPAQEPLQAPATGTEDSSPAISLPLAPAFTLTSASGETVSLEAYRGKSNVVLIFYRGFW